MPSNHTLTPTPTLLQMEAVECGAAALGMILGYYKRIVPLAELRQACGISRDGSSAANMLKAAKNYGLDAKGFKKGLPSLMTLQPPYIVFWQFDHFLVVEGFDKERVYVNDPAVGRRTVSLEEFDRGYTGIVLLMEPGANFQKDGKKKSVVKALQNRIKGSIAAFAYCILAGFLLVIPNLAVPVFSQVFIDNVLIKHRLHWVPYLIAGMLSAVIIQGLLTAFQLKYLRKLKIKPSVTMSSRFVWHLLKLPVSYP